MLKRLTRLATVIFVGLALVQGTSFEAPAATPLPLPAELVAQIDVALASSDPGAALAALMEANPQYVPQIAFVALKKRPDLAKVIAKLAPPAPAPCAWKFSAPTRCSEGTGVWSTVEIPGQMSDTEL